MPFAPDQPTSSELILPGLYQPRGAFTGQLPATLLRTANAVARTRARLVLEQQYGLDYRTQNPTVMTRSAYTRIAEGRRNLPLSVTHLTAEIFFRCFAAATVNHRIVCVGTVTDTGQDAPMTTGGEGAVFEYGNVVRANRESEIFDQYGGSSVARCDLALSASAPGSVRQIYVEAFAADIFGGGLAYGPMLVRVWSEVRG